MGREPNHFELAVFSLLWSEHCGYKHSAPLLRRLPSSGERVLQGPGENAGVIDLGDGVAVAFKAESHNHPSAVEPFQGAATGVGGILLELVEQRLVVSLQDCGAAGLASSLSEMARDSMGVDVDLGSVPLREADMEPWEIMISESQERMVAVVAPERVDEVRAACGRWELPCTPIGEVTAHGELRALFHGDVRSEERRVGKEWRSRGSPDH